MENFLILFIVTIIVFYLLMDVFSGSCIYSIRENCQKGILKAIVSFITIETIVCAITVVYYLNNPEDMHILVMLFVISAINAIMASISALLRLLVYFNID